MTQNSKPAYPAEFRQQMVELVALGRCPKQLSKEFGCHYTSIQTWCRAAGIRYQPNQITATATAYSGAPLNSNERQELMELRKKLRRVEMERDILAKATAWFANNKD
ncbi:MAG: transposase [Nitrosomonas sp.]|nr:transposase [Nitrosomonas sp.]